LGRRNFAIDWTNEKKGQMDTLELTKGAYQSDMSPVKMQFEGFPALPCSALAGLAGLAQKHA